MQQINATPDAKAVAEIQARLDAENAMLQHQQAQISLARGIAEADARIAESSAKEGQLQQMPAAPGGSRTSYPVERIAAGAPMSTVAATSDVLPRSKKALTAIAEAGNWDSTVQDLRARSESRAWMVAGASIVSRVCSGFSMASISGATRPIPSPVPIVVDRMTGESTVVVPQFDENSVPQISAIDQHNAAVFVRAYESYYFNLLKRDYDQVARMSTQEVFAPIQRQVLPVIGAMQTKLGTTWEHRVTVVSVRMSTTTNAGRNGEAIVTFDKQLASSQGITPTTTRYVATVRFEYRPRSMKKEVDRIENPFGFVVLSYRADPELLTPSTASARSS